MKMKYLTIVILSLVMLICPSCKTEEEKARDTYISMSKYILNKAVDAELSFLMDSNEWTEMQKTIQMIEYTMEQAQSLEKINDIGFYGVYMTYYGTVFLFSENEKRELISDLRSKYPEITQRLLDTPTLFEAFKQNT